MLTFIRKAWLKLLTAWNAPFTPPAIYPCTILREERIVSFPKLSKQLSSLTLICLRADFCILNTTISHFFINYLKIIPQQ